MRRSTALALLEKELDHQNDKWKRADGDWPSHIGRKMTVLAEEFGEVAIAINERDADNLLEELIDTAASAIAWVMSDFDEWEQPHLKTLFEVVA